MAEMNQEMMLQAMSNSRRAVSERANLVRDFIARYPEFRPLPIGPEVVSTLLEEVGFEAALLAALRLQQNSCDGELEKRFSG